MDYIQKINVLNVIKIITIMLEIKNLLIFIIVEDGEKENHYASLIFLKSNSKKIKKITVELEMLLRK